MPKHYQAQTPFALTHHRALQRRQSRRAFLHRSAVIGLSAPVVNGLLAACGDDDDDDEEEEPTPTAEPGVEPTATEPADEEPDDPTPTEAMDEPTPEDDEPEPSGGQAVIRFVDEPDSLFSGATGSTRALWVLNMIANGLTKLDQPSLDVTTDLAESWEVSDDGTVYTFTLHQDVLWQDGEPFTIEDVKFSYELWTHPEWPQVLGANFRVIEGAQAHKDGEAPELSGLRIIDEQHVEFTLTQPFTLFLANTAGQKLLPQHLLEDVPPADAPLSPFARSPVYTGPFMVEDWRAAESLIFRAFPDAFTGPPRLDSLVVRVITDPATAIAEVQTGALQLTDVPPDQFESFLNDPEYQTQELAGAFDWHLQFDLTLPLFEDKRVRQAMYHAIDRETIVDALLRGRAELTFGLIAPVSWLYNPNIPRFDYDPDRANELLDEAGWELGPDGVRIKDGERFEFSMLVITRTNEWAVALQPYMEAVGIRFQIEQVEFGTWIGRVYGQGVGSYEGTIGGWPIGTIDPRTDLQANFLSPRPGVDSTGYQNDEVDQLFGQVLVTTDREEEKELYDRIQEIVADDAVYVHLWQPHDLLVVRNDLAIPDIVTSTELYARVAEWELRS